MKQQNRIPLQTYQYRVLVRWANGQTEDHAVGATPLHVGVGDPDSVGPVPIFAPNGGHIIGALIVHGDERPEWTVAKVPTGTAELFSMLSPDGAADNSPSERLRARILATLTEQFEVQSVIPDDLSENDARRLHALADYATALRLLVDECLTELTKPAQWTSRGSIEKVVDRVLNQLQVLLCSAGYLIDTHADKLDLAQAHVG